MVPGDIVQRKARPSIGGEGVATMETLATGVGGELDVIPGNVAMYVTDVVPGYHYAHDAIVVLFRGRLCKSRMQYWEPLK